MPLAPTCAAALSPTIGTSRLLASSYVPSSAAFTKKVRATLGFSPAQKPSTPASPYTFRTTDPIVVVELDAVCICVFSTSVGLNTVIESAPAVPPARSRWAKLGSTPSATMAPRIGSYSTSASEL